MRLILTISTEITYLIFLQFALQHRSLPARKGSWNNYNNNNGSHIRLRKPSSVPLFPQIVSFYIPPFTSPSTFDSSGFCWQYQQRLACLIFLYNPLWHNTLWPVMEVKKKNTKNCETIAVLGWGVALIFSFLFWTHTNRCAIRASHQNLQFICNINWLNYYISSHASLFL